MILGMTVLMACSQREEVGQSSESVTANMVLSVSEKPLGLITTRMADAVVQSEGAVFRGLSVSKIIPFTTTGPITASDEPVDMILGDIGIANPTAHFYYYSNCRFTPGTASMLVYGKAPAASSEAVAAKMYNGSLLATFPSDLLPSGITFQLEPIVTAVPEEAGQIATYLTNVANTEGWSSASDGTLQNYYTDFISSSSLLAGSSASVGAYVAALEEKLDALSLSGAAETLKEAIKANIHQSYPAGYPSSKNLPDGAATLQWDDVNKRFNVLTESTAATPINSLLHFAYPSELYYYVNSPIHTSNDEVSQSDYAAVNVWEMLLGSKYPNPNSAVSHNTLSVAITSPLQYAVARLKITLEALPNTLPDASEPEENIPAGNANFPLTGIIIGGQRSLGFDFTPKEPLSDDDIRFIYDNNPAATVDDSGNQTVNTLVLQTYDNETVRLALEFKNMSGQKFEGAGGVIYPNTKFYLIGSVDPTTKDATDHDYNKRVFTQDCTTSMQMSVVSLAKAYNVMPNLLSPRLELGLVVTNEWVDVHDEDDTHPVYNW